MKVREDDGIYFTRAGADRIATIVFERLEKVRDLTSWKERRPKTTTAPTTAAVR